MTLFEFDRAEGVWPLCGVDEAGRGPLAGDVYAAACILPEGLEIEGLNDSKKLTEKKREALYAVICEKAVSYCVATASVAEIEKYNILEATFLAMRRAVEGLSVPPKLVLVDGNRNPRLPVHSRCVVKGDGTSASIAAASILAKVERDRYMKRIDAEYPHYQFAKHKGYGTALHYQMLDQFGPSPVHRLSFLKNYVPGAENPAQKRGRLGEEAACERLSAQGYEILERNWSCPYGEIDLIARKGEVLAFVEVKTRSSDQMGTPGAAVGPAKQKKLVKSALCYWEQGGPNLRARFDVAEVYLQKNASRELSVIHLNYIENAFEGEDI